MQWLTVVATSAVISALVSGLLTLWNAHLQRKADERKRMAELALKMAITEWESHMKLAEKGLAQGIQPPEIYLYRYAKLLPLIESGQVSLEKLKEIDIDVRKVAERPDS